MMLELAGHITPEGKLTVYKQDELTNWRMKHAGSNVVLTLKLKRKRRSAGQNGYYWAVVVPMVMEAINSYGNDFDQDETHEFLKSKFNATEIEVKDGGVLMIAKSTGCLSTVDFSDYCDRIRQFAILVLGVYIPEPNEQMTIDHYLNNQL